MSTAALFRLAIIRLAIILPAVAIWELVCRLGVVSHQVLTPPTTVATMIIQLIEDPDFVQNLAVTARSVVAARARRIAGTLGGPRRPPARFARARRESQPQNDDATDAFAECPHKPILFGCSF